MKYTILLFLLLFIGCDERSYREREARHTYNYQVISVIVNTSLNSVSVVCIGRNYGVRADAVTFLFDPNITTPTAQVIDVPARPTTITVTFKNRAQYIEYVMTETETRADYHRRTDS